MYCTGFYSSYAWRIGYYFIYLLIFLIPQIKLKIVFNKIRMSIVIPIILILMIYSYVYYDFYKFDETIPYHIIEKSN